MIFKCYQCTLRRGEQIKCKARLETNRKGQQKSQLKKVVEGGHCLTLSKGLECPSINSQRR